jgi:aspartate/methionine/tyrosine aminotransferase
MNIKSYLTNLKPSSTLVINEQSKEMERQGKEVIKFGFGQSPFPVPSNITEELKKQLPLLTNGIQPIYSMINQDGQLDLATIYQKKKIK